MFLKIPGSMSAMTSGEAARRRKKLGETVTRIRRRRRLSVDAAAARAPMSATTWQRVEEGKSVRTLTYRGVEEVLGLQRGILDEILDGTAAWAELDNGHPAPQSGKMISVEGLSDEEVAAFRHLADLLGERNRKDA